MIALVQRVSEARVEVDGSVVGRIDRGLLVLLGIHTDDTRVEADWLARKCAGLRIFSDAEDKMNLALSDVDGSALVVSQFTLYGDARKGNRPSFVASAPPEIAEPLYEYFLGALETAAGSRPERGVFGAMMSVHLVNDGPVTLIIERNPDD